MRNEALIQLALARTGGRETHSALSEHRAEENIGNIPINTWESCAVAQALRVNYTALKRHLGVAVVI